MDPYLTDWLNLIVRWIHLITGIAWIGASFYFNWLEGNLNRSGSLSKGVAGDLWAVHGGGFYHVQKFEVAPEKLPETLHWFKWEAYWTGITGLMLLFIVYYSAPGTYLVDTSVADISPLLAVFIGLLAIVLSWLGYDQLCKTNLVDKPGPFFIVVFIAFTIAAFLLSQVFNPRAAYIHIGAMIGIIMVANVFFVIIPSQRSMVDAVEAGKTPDGDIGKRGFQRSLHNNYFTLPVLFIMISNHFPFTYGHTYNWLILAALSAISIAVRHYFNLKNRGRNLRWILPAAALALITLGYVIAPNRTTVALTSDPVSLAEARQIVDTHCSSCHSQNPTDPAFQQPPGGVAFDSEQDLLRNAAGIYQRAVATHSMPLGNSTGMTMEERTRLGTWYRNLDE
ncbi:MAG: urate hydroxylase PuuD [Thiotrichales bacterium]